MMDFRTTPLIELETMIERSLAGGTTPEFAVKYLVDGGVQEFVARKIVADVEARVASDRAAAEEQERIQRQSARKVGWIYLAGGVLLIIASIILNVLLLMVLGVLLLLRGVRWLLRVG